MPAPSSTQWGDIIGGCGRIGIDVSVSNSDTESTVVIQTWFWSKYKVKDSNNSVYFNNESTSATTKVATGLAINHTVDTGTGWSTSNQTQLSVHNAKYTRGDSDRTIYCAAKFQGIDAVGSAMYATASYTIPGKAAYTISYDANGGTGAPPSQIKKHNVDATLSSIIPTRSGYLFLGWGYSSTSTEASFQPGGTYTANTSSILYAVWISNGYTVTYNANGGSYAPPSQTKKHDVALTLTTLLPLRDGYTFVGWGTRSTSTSVSYHPGDSYTTNANITLYAIWGDAQDAPVVTITDLYRCNASGTSIENGAYFHIEFDYSTDTSATASRYDITWEKIGDSEWHPANTPSYFQTLSTSSNHISVTLGSGELLPDISFYVTLSVTDSNGQVTSITKMLTGIEYSIDFLRNGKGAAFGKACDTQGELDVSWNLRTRGDAYIHGDLNILGTIRDAATTKPIMNSLISTYTASVTLPSNKHCAPFSYLINTVLTALFPDISGMVITLWAIDSREVPACVYYDGSNLRITSGAPDVTVVARTIKTDD